MKQKNQKKLAIKKFQISKLDNLKTIKGGYRFGFLNKSDSDTTGGVGEVYDY